MVVSSPRSQRITCAFLLSTCSAVVGCGNTGTVSTNPFTEEDSLGIRIVTTDARLAERPLDWFVSEEPDLRVGSEPAGEDYVFHRIAGARTAFEDRLVVADASSRQLRVYDRKGRFLGRFGRDGDGPGEFRYMRLVPSAYRDTVIVHDIGQRRLTYYAVANNQFETATVTLRARAIGISEGGVLFAAQTIMFRDTPGASSTPITYVLQRDGALQADTIGVFQGAQTYTSLDLGDIPSELELPFTASSSAAAAGSRIYLYDGTSSEIRVYSSDARLIALFRLKGINQEVTPEQHRLYVEQHAQRATNAEQKLRLRRVYASLDVPEHAALFRTLVIDETGKLWAQRLTVPGGAPLWMVFDTSGYALGTMPLPTNLEVHFIGVDHVLGRCRDDNDVENICRYNLRRPT